MQSRLAMKILVHTPSFKQLFYFFFFFLLRMLNLHPIFHIAMFYHLMKFRLLLSSYYFADKLLTAQDIWKNAL